MKSNENAKMYPTHQERAVGRNELQPSNECGAQTTKILYNLEQNQQIFFTGGPEEPQTSGIEEAMCDFMNLLHTYNVGCVVMNDGTCVVNAIHVESLINDQQVSDGVQLGTKEVEEEKDDQCEDEEGESVDANEHHAHFSEFIEVPESFISFLSDNGICCHLDFATKTCSINTIEEFSHCNIVEEDDIQNHSHRVFILRHKNNNLHERCSCEYHHDIYNGTENELNVDVSDLVLSDLPKSAYSIV